MNEFKRKIPIRTGMFATLCLILTAMLFPEAAQAKATDIIYRESFENEALPEGWAATSGKSTVVSEIPADGISAKSGQRALRAKANSAIERSFTGAETLDGAAVSVWIYDDMSDNGTAVMSLTGTNQTGIIFGLCTISGWNSGYYSYRFSSGGAGTKTVIRSKGWHKFTVDFSNSGSAILSIDGFEVKTLDITGGYDCIALGSLWYGNNSSSNVYMDNIAVERYKGLDVTGIEFTRNGTAVTGLDNGVTDCAVTITNTASESKDATLILALFKDGAFVKSAVADKLEVAPSATETLSCSIGCELDDDTDDYKLKAYIWNNLEELTPVTTAVQMVREEPAETLDVAPKLLPKADSLDNDFVYTDLGLKLNSSSVFLGYQRGINRDLAFYGWQATDATAWEGDYSQLSALADIDGDGFDDAVLIDDNNSISWRRNSGNGSFDEAQVLNAPKIPQGAEAVLGDFNGNGYADLAFVSDGAISAYTLDSGAYKLYLQTENEALAGFNTAEIKAGDFDGNGYCDLIAFGSGSGYLIMYSNGSQPFAADCAGTLTFAGADITSRGLVTVSDFNTDNHCDVVLYGSSAYPEGVLFLMGRGDGTFGITADEQNELWATSMYGKIAWHDIAPSAFVSGDLTAAYQHPDFAVVNNGGLLVRKQDTIHTAYDYSMHLIKDNGKYRLYSGGRWMTIDNEGKAISGYDGDHVLLSESVDGGYSWTRYHKPMFYKGAEVGDADKWWKNNVLEPEVIKVDNTYYMFGQVQINPNQTLPDGGTAAAQCDRIVLATSTDGYHWSYEAATTGSVIKNIASDVADHINIHHEEVIYVPDDEDGKPWWMYVRCTIDKGTNSYMRFRSADPRYFDYADGEEVSGMAQLGNQIGYINDAPGGRVFLRITFTGSTPYLQLSRNGLNWYTSTNGGVLAGVDTEAENASDNANCYFLGMATENGTGEITAEKDGTYRLVYAAATSNSASGKPIFLSEGGIGIATLKFK